MKQFKPMLTYLLMLLSITSVAKDNFSVIPLKSTDIILKARQGADLPYKFGDKLFLTISSSDGGIVDKLKMAGVSVDGFAGNGYFYITIPTERLNEIIEIKGIDGIGYLSPSAKISDFLLDNDNDLGSSFNNGLSLSLKIYFQESITPSDVMSALSEKGFYIERMDENFHYCVIRADKEAAEALASLPFVRYIGLQTKMAQPLLSTAIAFNRANKTYDASPNGLGLTGRNIKVAIIDGGYVGPHIDFEQRLLHVERESLGLTNSQHGTHVTGTIIGAGHRVDVYKGMAPKARAFEWNYSDDVINKMRQGIIEYGTMVSNNSYYLGEYGIFCGRSGEYVPESEDMDELSVLYPSYLPVLASGNSGNLCAGGWGTLPMGLQGSKNNLLVGRCDDNSLVDAGSSRGPTIDGRLKPELVAEGIVVASTFPNSAYGNYTGTSMSAPQVTGAVALLQEAYRNIHGVLPSAMLIKGLLCNTAYDLGTPGPDFINGFGRMDVFKAAKAIENGQYYTGSVVTGDSLTFSLNVPAQTASSKVMLTWTDPQATLPYSNILINDLDLYVKSTGGTITQPLFADAANPANPALEGKDRLNNMEQAILNAPAAGTYTIVVKGFNVSSGSQSFSVVYQNEAIGIDITFPDGGESILPGNNYIRWDANGIAGNLKLEYSLDNGSNWFQITDTVKASSSYYQWNVPILVSSQALIRASSGSVSNVSGSPFTFMPNVSDFNSFSCERGIRLYWTPIAQATDYLIYSFAPNDTAWKYIGTTTAGEYWVNDMQQGKTYYFTISSKNGTAISKKANAQQSTQNFFNSCATLNDAGIARILSPLGGRKFTSTAPSANEVITCVLKNYGSNTVKNFNVGYSINGNAPVIQFFNDSLPVGTAKNFTFSTTQNLSIPGNYTLKVWTSNTGDVYSSNDTFTYIVRHLSNDKVALPYVQNFDQQGTEYYTFKYIGIPGIEPFDLISDSIRARLRTSISDLYANSKPVGVTIDNLRGTGATDVVANLLMTLNLTNYADSIIFLDFVYSNHGESAGEDKVFVKGTDTQSAIEAYDLFTNKTLPGNFKTVREINLSKLLFNNSQNFSASTQVNFSVKTDKNAPSYLLNGGYSFDDVKVYSVGKDIAVTTDSSTISACEGVANFPFTIAVTNNTQAVQTNIPVYYAVNGGTPVKDTVTDVIPAFGTVSFTFTIPVAVPSSASAKYIVRAWSANPGDTYAGNDSTPEKHVIVLKSLSVTNPQDDDLYAASFEMSDGSWYTSGEKSSWVWGTPNKYNMPNAAMGQKSWMNNLRRDYFNNEVSYLYSPCLPTPGVNASFNFLAQLDIESKYDSIYMEYSFDGQNWQRFGKWMDGYNWYNATDSSDYWDKDISTWHVSSLSPLPIDGSSRPLALRFKLMTDQLQTFEGMGVDNVFYDNEQGDIPVSSYESSASTNTLTFEQLYAGSNKIIAEAKAAGTVVTINSIVSNTAASPSYREHFLLNTRWLIENTSGGSGGIHLRLYFADSMFNQLLQTDNLLQAINKLELVRYDGVALDTSMINNHFNVGYTIFDPADFNIWPFKKGYFVEFNTDKFGEFWLRSSADNPFSYNSTRFSDFEASRDIAHALLEWTTIQEVINSRFRLEYSSDGTNYNLLDSVQGGASFVTGSKDYTYIDSATTKSNIMYYRMSQVDSFGNVYYAGVDTVDFTNTPVSNEQFQVSWQSDGLWLTVNGEFSGPSNLMIYNSSGALLDKYDLLIEKGRNYLGKGYMSAWPAGIYIIQIEAANAKGSSKFIKTE